MKGPRSPDNLEYPKVLSFLDENLRSDVKWSISDEYPTAINPKNQHNIRIITDEENVLSHAVWRPLLVQTKMGLYKVAMIGSVVTNETHRNQGLSRKIIEDCVTQAEAHGCDFAILWTDKYDFYRKLGFELAGTEYCGSVDRELQNAQEGLRIVEGAQIAPEALLKVYQKHTVHSLRNLEEIRSYLQIPNSRIYTAWSANNTLEAYAVEGKGKDLDAHIHEWGGNVKAIFTLINHIRTKQNRNIQIMIPEHSSNLRTHLEEQGVPCHKGFLGMIKLLNHSTLFSKVLRHARAGLNHHDFHLHKNGDEFHFGVNGKNFTTDKEVDIAHLIFGPLKPSEIYGFDKATAQILDQIFPLPMWIWGWDSI